jgi:hypothetical protein
MKMCEYHPSKRCYHFSCDSLDNMGNVVVCPLLPNPFGRLMRRVVIFS